MRKTLLQDIFERIDNFRGGEGGAVKLKDLIRFLRAVCENIDQNFKVFNFLNLTKKLLPFYLLGDFAAQSAFPQWRKGQPIKHLTHFIANLIHMCSNDQSSLTGIHG